MLRSREEASLQSSEEMRGILGWERGSPIAHLPASECGRELSSPASGVVLSRGSAMITRGNGRDYECVTVDLNTQQDFCAPNGAYPVANLDELLPALRRVFAWTKRNYAPMVSSLDSHRPRDLPEANRPIHCVDGSRGQRKIPFTIFPLSIQVEVDNTLAIPLDLFGQHQQVVFRLRTDDLLTNPKADRFLTQLPAEEFIVFGNCAECAVKALVLGLLARHKKVSVVADACGYWNKASAELALRQMAAKGARLITVDELRSRKLSRSHRYPVTSVRRNGGNGREGRGLEADGKGRHTRAHRHRPVSKNPGAGTSTVKGRTRRSHPSR